MQIEMKFGLRRVSLAGEFQDLVDEGGDFVDFFGDAALFEGVGTGTEEDTVEVA